MADLRRERPSPAERFDSPPLGRPAPTLELDGDRGQLVPVCDAHAHDEGLIALLARWRIEHEQVYPTRFPVTLGGTRTWLQERVLAVPDRFMFLVIDPSGHLIGHAGLAQADGRTAKLDNVMRGVPDRCPGIMSAAVRAVLAWASVDLARDHIHTRVFISNIHTIRFLWRLGFRDDSLIPLRKITHGERTEYVPFDPAIGDVPDDYHLRLVYRTS